MKPRDLLDLVLLAAVWGSGFLLLRVATPEFGAVPLIAVRCAIAAAALLPIVWLRGGAGTLRENVGRIGFLGIVNSAIPFSCFAFATLSLSAGMASILNATAPLFTALVASLVLREGLGAGKGVGLAVGFAGVVVLVTGKASFAAGGAAPAVAACLVATLLYGIAANYTKRRLSGIPSVVIAGGSQVAAALSLAPIAAVTWPDTPPSGHAWASAVGLGILCTAFAYLLFFRLIERAGPTRAMSVTYLIPVFGTAWGSLLLDEPVTPRMIAGGAIVALGVAWTTGAFRRRGAVAPR